jgi:hypothetical protein
MAWTTQVIMLTWPILSDVASWTWLDCASVKYAEVAGGAAEAVAAANRTNGALAPQAMLNFMERPSVAQLLLFAVTTETEDGVAIP